MENKTVGIQDQINKVHSRPKQYADKFIAPLVIRNIKQDELMLGRGRLPSAKRIVITADHHETPKQTQEISDLVVKILEEQLQLENGRSHADGATYDLIAQACTQLLGNWLREIGEGELAHFLHSSRSHTNLHSTKLALLDHRIIPENQSFHELSGDTEIWHGHETKKEYRGKKQTRNIIVGVTRDKSDHAITTIYPLLKAEIIHITKDHILGFSGNKVSIHAAPSQENNQEFTLPILSTLNCDIGKIEEIKPPLSIRTGWQLYRITGTSTQENAVEGDITTTQKITLCVNLEKPDLSYVTPSKRFIMDGNVFTLDTTKKVINVLSRGEVIQIPYTSVGEIIKENNGQEYFTFTQDGGNKKLTIGDGKPEIISL